MWTGRHPRTADAVRYVSVATTALLLAGCSGGAASPPGQEPAADLPSQVRAFSDLQRRPEAGFLLPAHPELLAAALLAGGTVAGYHQVLSADGYRLALPRQLPDPHGTGLLATRASGARLVVEVPHPVDDLDTDLLGAELTVAAHAGHLLVAGGSRRLSQDRSDVAHAPQSVFQSVHEALARQGIAALQVHGFAETSLPGVDVVVSTGSSRVTGLVRAVADAAEAAGFRTCRAWMETCGRLEGRTNVQGLLSGRVGVPFVHLEVVRSVRADPRRRQRLVAALAGALTADLLA